ncbi:MAG: hypothetical protein K8I60_03105 [Anaerolineae bacterium]|nr:hypothetical protein [Anaerolineae bacterium]
MAAPHVFVVYTVQDAKGAKSTMKINFGINADIGVLKDFVTSTASMIDALIKGKIVDAGIGLAVDLPGGLKASPLADSDVEEGARFSFRTALNTLTQFRMPTFDEAFISPGSRSVDTADGTVDTFVQRILAGRTVGVTNVSPSDDHGEDITALDGARESFSSSRG